MKKFDLIIDKKSSLPVYRQIYECIKDKIDRAELVENQKLPSIRQLSIKLKINNLTILKAYNLLESENYIYKKQGTGAFVKKKEMLLYFTPPKELMESFQYHEAESPSSEYKKYHMFIDFVSGSPSKEILPYDEFKELTKVVFEKNGAEMFGYHDTQGYKRLRCFLSRKLEKQGISVPDKNIQITSGSQQGIDILIRTLVSKRNNKIITGNPTYHGALNNFKKECKVFGVSVEKDGFDMKELENILSTENINFIYTMINYQSPTGICWSNEKKKQLIELAEKYNTYIIEDDCLSEIYFGDKQKSTLKSLDKDNTRVIYIKSFSKVIMPGLRIGYMIVPDEFIDQVVTAKFTSDISSSGFEQRMLFEFLKDDYIADHFKKLRMIYKSRYEFTLDQINKSKYLDLVYPIQGGVHCWVRLPDKINSNIFFVRCRSKGVSILPGTVFFFEQMGHEYFRLSFASVNKEEIKNGIDTMNKVIEEMLYYNQSKENL